MMNLEHFWSIIETSRDGLDSALSSGNMSKQVERLKSILAALAPHEIGAFSNRFLQLFHKAYDWDLWAAGFIIGGGCSDDSFMDFRYWLISMGRSVYDDALNNVESLANVAFRPDVECPEFEEFGYVADGVMQQLGISEEDAGIMEFEHPDEPTGEKWKEEDLAMRFPKLTSAEAQFGA